MLDGKQTRLVFRMEKIARLRAASVPDKDIARVVNLTPAGLATLLQRPDYRQLEKEILAQTTQILDEALANDVTAMRQHFAHAVPEAMRSVIDILRQNKDLKTRLEAAKEVFDRDPNGTFSKSTLSFNAPSGTVVDVPAAVFNHSIEIGRGLATSVPKDTRQLVDAMVPKAIEEVMTEEDVEVPV